MARLEAEIQDLTSCNFSFQVSLKYLILKYFNNIFIKGSKRELFTMLSVIFALTLWGWPFPEVQQSKIWRSQPWKSWIFHKQSKGIIYSFLKISLRVCWETSYISPKLYQCHQKESSLQIPVCLKWTQPSSPETWISKGAAPMWKTPNISSAEVSGLTTFQNSEVTSKQGSAVSILSP